MGSVNNEIYKPLYTSKKRYYLVTGGRASLKSSTVHEFIARLTYEKGHGILFTRYTMTSAEASIIPEFLLTLDRLNIRNNFDVTKRKIINKHTGSFIYFSGIKTSSGDQTANLKSISGITTWVIEEGEDYNDEKSFDTIDDSIRTAGIQNRVIWIQNPSSKEHFIYKRWIENTNTQIDIEGYKVTVSNNEDVCHIHSYYGIAEKLGYLSKAWLKKASNAKINKPKWYYHNYIGGWLEKPEGVIFPNWIEGYFDESLNWEYGLDFGYANDPDVMIRVGIDEKRKKLYIDEVFYEYQQELTELRERIRSLEFKRNTVADSAELRLISYLSKELNWPMLPAKKPPDSIKQGIKLMQDYEIIITPKSKNVKIEFNNYAYGKNNNPIDEFNHAIDPARYVVFMRANNLLNYTSNYEDTNTRFVRGDHTGADAAPWISEFPIGNTMDGFI